VRGISSIRTYSSLPAGLPCKPNGQGDWDSWTCANAAYNGHLEVLQWARKSGCDWDSWTCTRATQNEHLEVLKWARDNGCPEN